MFSSVLKDGDLQGGRQKELKLQKLFFIRAVVEKLD